MFYNDNTFVLYFQLVLSLKSGFNKSNFIFTVTNQDCDEKVKVLNGNRYSGIIYNSSIVSIVLFEIKRIAGFDYVPFVYFML